MKKIPVILDTDIGIDIDDTWALAMLLNCPRLDLKLVTTATGDTHYRAAIAAKLLEAAGRTDVPVGIGIESGYEIKPQQEWIKHYDLSSYPGTVYNDAVESIINTIMHSPDPVTIICIGPLSNISEALRREPKIVHNARFVGMHGSIFYGLDGEKGRIAEYNVVQDISAAQHVFSADWSMTITPLDTCGIVRLESDCFYRKRRRL